MTATITWHQPKKRVLKFEGTSSELMDALHNAFGSSPWHLSEKHVDTLLGISAANVGGASEIIEKISDSNGDEICIDISY